jgi:hypothetical protein
MKIASMSPMIQNAQMQQDPNQSVNKEDIFNKLFSDQAYKAFTTKFPYLIDYIQHFKVINTDVDTGYAVGAFFIQVPNSQNYFMVPIILQNNSIQPIMFIYDKQMDLFLPLDQQWVNEIFKRIEQDAGSIVKPDEHELLKNNNITTLSQLPQGRGINGLIHKLGSLSKVNIPEIVATLDKEAKEKFLKILNTNEKVAKRYFSQYGLEEIKESFKVAENKTQNTEDNDNTTVMDAPVLITSRTPLDYVKKEFAKDHVVMDDLSLRGYHIKDKRNMKNKMVVFTDHMMSLENPTESGPYDLYMSSGKVVPAFIIQDPILIDAIPCELPKTNYHPGEHYKTYHVIAKNSSLVLFPNGNYTTIKNDNALVTPIIAETLSDTPVYKSLFGDKTESIPLNKPFIFIKKVGGRYITTGPITVKTKVDEGDAIRCTTNYGGNTIIYSSNYPGNSVYVTKNNTVIVPNSFKVLVLKDEVPKDMIIGSMKTIMTLTTYRLLESGGKPLTIVKDDQSQYAVETNRPMRKPETIIKISQEHQVNAKEVEAFLDSMDAKKLKVANAFVLPKEVSLGDVLTKEAQGFDPNMLQQMQMQQGMGQGMGQMDPTLMSQMGMGGQQQMGQPMMGQQQMGMDPAMMQQMAMMGQQPMDQSMGMMPQGQMGPEQMMSQGADMAQSLENDALFDTSALMGLSYISQIEQLFPKYLPVLIKAMDNIGRIILNFWINAEDIQEDLGITEYGNLENKLKTLYNNLSDLLITLNKKIDIFSYQQGQ